MDPVTRWIRDPVVDPAEDPAAWREGLKAARIPDKFWCAKASQVRDESVRRWAATLLRTPGMWLGKGYGFFLHGPENTGKSSLAAVFAMDALKRAEQPVWLHVRDIPGVRFRETPELAKVDDSLRSADLLVLDDLGAERFKLSSAAGPALEETIRIFYERGRSIIVTSNINWEAFQTHYSIEARPLVSVLARVVIPAALVLPWPSAPGLDLPRVGEV